MHIHAVQHIPTLAIALSPTQSYRGPIPSSRFSTDKAQAFRVIQCTLTPIHVRPVARQMATRLCQVRVAARASAAPGPEFCERERTAHTGHPVHPILIDLISGGSKGAILRDLPHSRTTYSHFVFHRNRFYLSGITRHIRKHGRPLGSKLPCATLSPAHDSNLRACHFAYLDSSSPPQTIIRPASRCASARHTASVFEPAVPSQLPQASTMTHLSFPDLVGPPPRA